MIQNVHKAEDELQLNMTPMIDMIFLLIIFFLTATTFAEREREHEVQLPQTQGAGSLSKVLDKNLYVNVKRDGALVVSGKVYSIPELEALVRDRNERAQKALKVQIRSDGRATVSMLTVALDAVQKAGVPRPFIATRVLTEEP